jgi:hypothetical protein
VRDIGDRSQIRFSGDFKISFHTDTIHTRVWACPLDAAPV